MNMLCHTLFSMIFCSGSGARSTRPPGPGQIKECLADQPKCLRRLETCFFRALSGFSWKFLVLVRLDSSQILPAKTAPYGS